MKKLIAIIVAGLATGSAAAQDQIAIRYSDVVTAADANALYRRIRNAADAVCQHDPGLGLLGHSVSRKCKRDAVARAVEDVDNPLLTARHHGDTGATLYSSRATRK